MSATTPPTQQSRRVCAHCRFYQGGNTAAAEKLGVPPKGGCHRYPAFEHKIPSDWCGEWAARESER